MSLLTPLFLLLSLLAIPIILLYMLRLRRQEVMVSSTFLWQKLLRDREANAPWQKLRRNLLLILQLLILAALVFALARPFWPVPSVVNSSVVVLLDGSASMHATDTEEESRFATAQKQAHQLINDLGSTNQMAIILVGRSPLVIAQPTSDKNSLHTAVTNATPENGTANWPAAFALAAGAAQGFTDAQVIILSDGQLPANLPTLPAELIHLPMGSSSENLAISALATRETAVGIELFASVTNHGNIDRQTLLSLTLDGVLYDARRITVPAQSSANTSWELPPNTAVIQAHLSDIDADHLPLDNIAWAVHEGGLTNRTLLVTEGNLFLEQLFAVLPGVELFKATPDSDLLHTNDTEPFDLYIFDSVATLPDPLPNTDMLIINPQANSAADLFSINGTFSDTVTIRLADTPLLQYVDWGQVNIRVAQQVAAPWAQTLVQAVGGPLIQIGEQNGRRIALINFDLRDSDLPLQIAFPILMANLTGWLNPGSAFDTPTGLQPGDAVAITPETSTTAVTVIKPDGSSWQADVEDQPLIFSETQQLGLYQLLLRDNSGQREAGHFVVNLFHPLESAISPAVVSLLGETAVDDEQTEAVGQREFWSWLVLLAFLILLVEWWVHFRGAQWPASITQAWQTLRGNR